MPLPLYPFERRRYWIEPRTEPRPAERAAELVRREETADWLSKLVWRESAVAAQPLPEQDGGRWLLLADRCGLAQSLAARLSAAGHAVVTVEAADAQEGGARLLADLQSGLLPTRSWISAASRRRRRAEKRPESPAC